MYVCMYLYKGQPARRRAWRTAAWSNTLSHIYMYVCIRMCTQTYLCKSQPPCRRAWYSQTFMYVYAYADIPVQGSTSMLTSLA